MNESVFDRYLKAWALTIDGDPIASLNGQLFPVRHGDIPAMLKVSHSREEQAGGQLMAWWEGNGAAPVLCLEGEALLMKRAQGTASLARMARTGLDDQATRILCAVIARLHEPRTTPLPELVPLEKWFDALWPAAATYGGILQHCAKAARELLAAPRDVGVLHGDIHHGNVLDFGPCGWLAIDPKGLYGERGFDYANMLCNPDDASVLAPGCFSRRIGIICEAAHIDRQRLMQWALAWAGLSATWMMEDGVDPVGRFELAKLAALLLDGSA
ncbi:aminoglycoside phosphotransferase family protein [Pseudomonas sp. CM27]|uniref:aminoglycoside phosphotransferase family protein n=1 Tax=Pseudomonas sp. CM27 TaxID=2738452 RepID=UPI001554C342|nr:aminoglycoside phosphotransferase family protein [Pseudomonas sp. CM27]NQD75360.1 APH(6) family putative aminoglycoside O-phosphotransferase [Pseudomonas sp. CM27]